MTSDLRRPPYTEDSATKRARILAALDMERMRPASRPDRFDEFDRRLERIEAAIYALTDRLERAEAA